MMCNNADTDGCSRDCDECDYVKKILAAELEVDLKYVLGLNVTASRAAEILVEMGWGRA